MLMRSRAAVAYGLTDVSGFHPHRRGDLADGGWPTADVQFCHRAENGAR